MLLLYCIWGIFCILEILNPNNVQEAWNIAFSQYVVYPVLCAILILISIKKTNNINQIAKRVNSTGVIYKDDINDMREEIEQFSKELWQIHTLLLDRTRKNEDN